MRVELNIENLIVEYLANELSIDQDDQDNLRRDLSKKSASQLLIYHHNWTSRFIKPCPREVHISKTMENSAAYMSDKVDVDTLIAKIRQGQDITPHLSERVANTVISAETNKLSRRTDLDMLLNDWGIHHLHISSQLQKNGFVERGKCLLFCKITHDRAYCIKIGGHNFVNIELIEILIRELPIEAHPHKLEGILPPPEQSQDDIKQFRNLGINSILKVDGCSWTAGGYSTAGTSVKATMDSDDLIKRARRFERAWNSEESRLFLELNTLGIKPKEADLTFMFTTEGPGLLDQTSEILILLP